MASLQTMGLGTAAIGRPQYINIRQEEPVDFSMRTFKQAGRFLLEEAYRLGMRYFDTAPGYGMAEQLLLDWVLEKEDRNIQVASKWGYTYVANFDANANIHEVKNHSLMKLNGQWLETKAFLPFLATYQIHSATFDTDVLNDEAVLQKLMELKDTHDEIRLDRDGLPGGVFFFCLIYEGHKKSMGKLIIH